MHVGNTPSQYILNQPTRSIQVYDACRGIYRFRAELSQFLVMHLIVDLLSNARSLKEYQDHLNNIATEICHVLEGVRRSPSSSSSRTNTTTTANATCENTALDQSVMEPNKALLNRKKPEASCGLTTTDAFAALPPTRERGHEQVGVWSRGHVTSR